MENEKKRQWHPAFFAGMQIELKEDADKLTFEQEHYLSSKPLQIDILIIRKNSKDRIQKNIGRIFRRYNIVEYKSPDDYLSIDDFYKVYAYCCLYKSAGDNQDEKKADDITITFICNHYPLKLLKHSEKRWQIRLENFDKGIYYLKGDIFPMQLIVTYQLSEEENLWLKNITNQLEDREIAEKLIKDYKKHEQEELYQAVMNIIVQANQGRFKEEKSMLEALKKLFKDELAEKWEGGMEVGRGQGEMQKLLKLIQKKLQKGKSYDEIADELETELYIVEQICEVINTSPADTTQEELVEILMEKNLLKEEMVSV